MNRFDDLDRTLGAWFATEAAGPPPDALFERVAADVRKRRPRPAWLASLHSRPAAPGLSGPALIALGLLFLALVAGAVYVGSQLARRVDPAPPAPAYQGVIEPIGPAVETGLEERIVSSVVVLPDGRVFITDATNRATIWDPETGARRSIGPMLGNRGQPAAVLLKDGRVLVIGGDNIAPDASGTSSPALSTAELFDPRTEMYAPTGPMTAGRFAFAAIALDDGRVLVLGGEATDGSSRVLASAELYDPATNSFSVTGSMSVPRYPVSVTRLADGRVLIAGGVLAGYGRTKTSEIYDPATGTFSPAPPVAEEAIGTDGVLLPDGRVLIIHGWCTETTGDQGAAPVPAELFDPVSETYLPAAPLPHCVARAAALPDGTVFVTGWWYDPPVLRPSPLAANDFVAIGTGWTGIYDPQSGATRVTASTDRYRPGVAALADGRVLLVGGFPIPDGTGNDPLLSWAQLYR